MLSVKINHKMNYGSGFVHKCTYSILGTGIVYADNQIFPYGELPSPAQIGISFVLNSHYRNIKWFGRGPFENYFDRKSAAAIALYSSTVEEQYVPYIVPQSTGSKQDVRWALFTNNKNEGIMIAHRTEPFTLNALHYRQQNLKAAKHTNELEKDDDVYITIATLERGVGTASSGTSILSGKESNKTPTSFSYILSPYNSASDEPAAYARNLQAGLSPSPPMVIRDAYGLTTISSILPKATTYYTIDGSIPTKKSFKYDKPFVKISSGIIKAISYIEKEKSSTTLHKVKQLQVLKPIISLTDKYFSDFIVISLTSHTPKAELRYTIDGSEPGLKSLLYKNKFKINESVTLKVRAFKKGHKPSEIISSKYKKVKLGEGVEYRYYLGKFGSTPNYLYIIPDKIQTINQFRLEDIKNVATHYAVLMMGSINVKKSGEYTFYCGSNDGSRLSINNTEIIENDGGHGYQEKEAKIYLEKGIHRVEVRYFQTGGGQELKISWKSTWFGKREVTTEDLLGK